MAGGDKRHLAVTAAAVGLVAFLPFLRGALAGNSFYFRDLSRQFLPLRLFALEGLLRGELRFWDPYAHEGVPLSLPPLSYPVDLLQLLLPDERGISLLLALHVPFAGLAFLALGRRLGLSALAAAAGALVYALGGFVLSTVNLYVYLQAAAWAPLLVVGLAEAARGGRRSTAVGALLAAAALSTTGVEIVLQTVIFALVLAWPGRDRGSALRFGAALGLGLGLAAAPLAAVTATLGESARAAGFPAEVVLAQSVHPLTLVQIVVAGLYGDLSRLAERFWGMNFFPLGFPYVLSLYLGLPALCLAAVGAMDRRAPRRILLLALLALLACLGRWAGFASLVEAVAPLRLLRYPVKAFFTVHLAAALLAGFGLQALADGARRAWRRLTLASLGLGALLAAAGAFAQAKLSFFRGFFPPGYPERLRLEALRFVTADAETAGLLAVAAGLIGLVVLAGRLQPRRAGLALAALLAVDLLRTGAGLNPMVSPAFFRLSEPMAAVVAALRQEGGRVFTLDPGSSHAYAEARARRGTHHEIWTFATLRETLTPDFNVADHVPAAYSLDRTMLVPVDRVASPADMAPESFPRLLDRLRAAGVAHVLSLDPLWHPDLEPRAVVAPERLAPLVVHVYRLRQPLPLRFVAREVRPAGAGRGEATAGLHQEGGVFVEGAAPAVAGAQGRVVSATERPGRIELRLEADRPTVAVVREAFAKGWSARVDGHPAPVLRADGRHCAVAIPAGVSRVVLVYRPPLWAAGLLLSGACALLTLWLGRPAPERR